MTKLEELFEKHEDEYLKFKRVHPQLHLRADIHAFLLLDKLMPNSKDIVAGAEHDKIYLDVDLDELEKIITEEQVIDLIRCGVHYEDDSFCMFV